MTLHSLIFGFVVKIITQANNLHVSKYVDAPKELINIIYLIILLYPTKICLEVRLQNVKELLPACTMRMCDHNTQGFFSVTVLIHE